MNPDSEPSDLPASAAAPAAPDAASIAFTVADFNRLGHSSGFRYKLPHANAHELDTEDLCIAEGRIDTSTVGPGFSLITSELDIHKHYEATSYLTPHFSVIVLLQGNACLEHDVRLTLRGQTGLSVRYSDSLPMTAAHAAGQRIRSVNLTVLSPSDLGDDQSGEMVAKSLRSPGPRLRPWHLQTQLALAIEHLFNCTWSGSLREMLREGISLQLLSHGLHSHGQQPSMEYAMSPRDRRMLERVREKLHDCPGEDHSLMELARLACMSPSTLRSKFHAAYHCTIFNWLRQRRLEVAREQLAQGWSVQQAAHYVGYRHATNFATAFRERYGVSPSRLLPG